MFSKGDGFIFARGDLHIHSTASDGCYTPKEIVILAKRRGIDTIAITDHNSIAGLTEAAEAGKEYNVSIIPAVELSTRFNNESIHILGYFKNNNYNKEEFAQLLKLVRTREANTVKKMLLGYRKHDNMDKYLSTYEGISLLRTFGAAVVLAHPVRISENNLPTILNMPFDGIESKYCKSNDYYTNFFIDLALKKFSFYTGGSDFHTDNINDEKHCLIGEPCLESWEIIRFLEKSCALVLGNCNNNK